MRERPAALAAAEAFGPWRVLEVLGEGASGRIFLARRGDFDDGRRVAIKTLRSPSPAALARFELERQALARLEHPSIARLYDAGKNDAGVPYVVMEHVAGLPIDDYCEREELSVEARLRLFLEVCQGVQHAHRNLIVHRDLKPANILVDDEGRPRLLDFGIARLLDAASPTAGSAPVAANAAATTGLADATARTPAYASPEQILGRPITTAADVFSLGIVLYELLTGLSPWGNKSSRHELERAICEDDPEPAARAARRSHPRFARRLRGEIEAILKKALARQPEARYASVEALARDIESHLEHQPVIARPPSLLASGRLFLRRHLAAAMAAGILLVAIGIFLLVLARQARVLRAERDKAEQALAFLVEVFRAGEPGRQAVAADQLTARQILDRAAERVQQELAGQPEAQATLLGAIGEVYFSLGLYRDAAHLQELALLRRRDLQGDDNLETATTRYLMADALVMGGEPARAEELYRQALEVRRPRLPADSPVLIENLIGLATALEIQDAMKEAIVLRREVAALTPHVEAGKRLLVLGTLSAALSDDRQFEDAAEVNDEAYALAARSPDQSTADFADGLFEAAVALSRDQDPRSLPLFERALAIRRRLLPADHPRLLESEGSVALALLDDERWQEALALLDRVVAGKYRQLGKDHYLVAHSELARAWCIGELGDWDQAVALAAEVLARAEASGKKPGELAAILNQLSVFERRQGKLDDAWRHLLRAEKYLIDSKAERPALVVLMLRQATLEADLGKPAVARDRLELLIGEMKDRFPAGNWRLAWAEAEYARVLALLGRDAEAEPLAKRCYDRLSERFGSRSRFLRPALQALQVVYGQRGDDEALLRVESWLRDPSGRPGRLEPIRIEAAPFEDRR